MNEHRMTLPSQRQELGAVIFLISLGTFFVFTLLGYLIIRGIKIPSYDQISEKLPLSFWLSTPFLLIGSHFLFRAVRAVKREKIARFKTLILLSTFMAILFVGLQSQGIAEMFKRFNPAYGHESYQPVEYSPNMNGSNNETMPPEVLAAIREAMQTSMIGVLVGVHILHFVGGIIFLGYLLYHAFKGRYDHECHTSVKLTAYYWRMLDVVWVCMLFSFCVSA